MTTAEIHNFLDGPLELLPGWYDDWVLLERERLRQLWLHGLEAAARRLGRLRRFDLAVDAAMLAIRIEPLRESAHRTLAELHLDEGNAGAARRCYDAFTKLLRDELDIAPSLAFAALVDSPAAATNRAHTSMGGTCGRPGPRVTAPTSWGRPPSDRLKPRS